MKTITQIGEISFIKSIAGLCRTDASVVKGIGDDAAVVRLDNNNFLLWTADMLIEKVHFTRAQPPELIGHKAIAASLSDIAAMGGIPRYALVGIGLPKRLSFSFARRIYRGLAKTARRFGVGVIGGDTNAAPQVIIDVSLCGVVEKKRVVFRSGAKPGDAVFVTGRLGGSRRGRHLRFIPRIKEARFLVTHYPVNSMIDISDGLALDLSRILEQSRAGAVLFERQIPLSAAAASLADAYYSGEDFELLFTLPEKYARGLPARWPFSRRTLLTRIGIITAAPPGIYAEDRRGRKRKLKISGYRHF